MRKHQKTRFVIVVISLFLSLLVGSLALFERIERNGPSILFAYVGAFAFGGFRAIVFGVMRVNNFSTPIHANHTKGTTCHMHHFGYLARAQLLEHRLRFWKYCSATLGGV